MPASCDPNARKAIWLKYDENAKPRPTFFVKVLTERDALELAEAIDRWHQLPIEDESLDLAWVYDRGRQLIRQYVQEWEHMPEHFKLEMLDVAEMRELLGKILWSVGLSAVEKKDCESQHSSEQESCVSVVA